MDKPPLFKDENVHSLDHLKSPVPYWKLSKGKEVDVNVWLDDPLYEDVPEGQYKPIPERIRKDVWDENCVDWLSGVLPLLNPRQTPQFLDAVVFIFFLSFSFLCVLLPSLYFHSFYLFLFSFF
jgi:hypothetical protein